MEKKLISDGVEAYPYYPTKMGYYPAKTGRISLPLLSHEDGTNGEKPPASGASLTEKVEPQRIDVNSPKISLNPNKTIVSEIGLLLGRSLFPLTAIMLIMGTILWGSWVSFILAFVWFAIVLMRFG